jgi:SAM-dependent methyltransferase
LNPEQLGTLKFYDENAEHYCQSTVNLDLNKVYETFLKEIPFRGHILDAGCGSGRDTRAFLDRGYRVTAIEASPALAGFAKAFTKHPCEILLFQDMSFHAEFDGIWACASLLHIPKREISDLIPRFIDALKAAGIFYLSLKEGEGERVASDGRFFSDYTADSFREILAAFPLLQEIAFWKTEEVRSQTHRQPWLNFLLQKNTKR